MSTEITITSTTIDINVTESPITIEAPSGAYPLPTSVYSVFGRTGNIVATEGDYTLTQLAGVTITSPSSGQALVYNGTAWVNNTETYVGTVTSVSALTLGTTGTDLTSTVANSTTTPVITLNVPTASASNRGALSSADWSIFNAKQPALNGTGFVKISGTTISYDNSTYYLASNPTAYIPLTALSSTATGLTYTNTTGVFSTTGGYGIPTTAKQTTWDTAYNDSIISASVTGVTTKTLTLNQQDGGTIVTTWTDYDTAPVTSVFGRTGAVVAVNGDYTTSLVTEGTNLYYTQARFDTAFAAKSTTDLAEGANLYYTDVRARASNSFVAGSGAYNSTTGVITIPTDNSQIANSAAYITLTGLSATTPLSYNNTTGVFTISQSNTSTNGYLSSTDWNTFNNKEAAITAGTISQYYRGDKTFQILDTSAVPEATNLYYTQARFDTAFSNKTTTNLTEGTNLYYTDTRARAAITGTSPISVTSGVVAISQSNTTTNGYISFTDWNTFNGKQTALNGTGFVKISGTTISYDNSTYLTTIEGITAGGELSGTYASPSLVNSAVTGKILTGVNVTGGSISATDSILTAFGKVQNQINGLIGGSIYQGTWNANTNTPTLTSSVGTSGYYYIVSVAGTTNLNGITDWQVGDWAIFNGGVWQKVDNTDAVVSVNGFTGAVSLTTSNINEGTNLYFTNARTIASTLTSYTSGAGTITSSDTILTAIQKLNGNIGSIVSGVSSVFGRTGAVVSGIGDYTTSQVTEGTNLYFTDTRARAAISLTTTGTSGAATYVSGVLNIPNYGSALTGYVPYTGATQDVDLGAFKLNAQSLHAKGTGGLGHLGLKHQSLSATASANEVSLFADSNGDLSWVNGNVYLSKFITSSNTANRSYTFPNATGTIALTSDISYPVTSVFGRTGVVIATSGDYTTTQVTEGTNLYYTDTRARASLSFVAGSGAYNSTTGVITIPTNNTQITNGSNYITLTSLSATTPLSYNNTTGAFTIAQATTSTSGYLSSTDWTTFNNKQSTITNPVTGTGTQNYHTKWNNAGGTSIGNSLIWDNGTNVGIGNTNTSYTLDVSGTLRGTTSAYFATASGSVGIGTVSPSDKFSVDAGTGNIVTSSFFNSTMTAGQSTFLEFGKNYSNNYNTGELAFKFVGDGSSSNMVSIGFYGAGNKLNVLGNGNVGIGTSNPLTILHLNSASGTNSTLLFGVNGTWNGYLGQAASAGSLASGAAIGDIVLRSQTNLLFTSGGDTERMRITSGGYTKISNSGTYEYVSAAVHEIRNSAADYILYATNPNANPSGYYISYPSASPNSTANYFIACADSTAARFRVASNGNCYNVTGTYTSGVSDIRYKEQIVDANSQWNDIKNLRVVNFKFIKDVEENGDNALRHIGFIAQEVEKTSPHLIDEMSDEKTGETWKTIKTSIIHTKSIKALQEAMARIETLESTIQNLQEQNQDLKSRLDKAGL